MTYAGRPLRNRLGRNVICCPLVYWFLLVCVCTLPARCDACLPILVIAQEVKWAMYRKMALAGGQHELIAAGSLCESCCIIGHEVLFYKLDDMDQCVKYFNSNKSIRQKVNQARDQPDVLQSIQDKQFLPGAHVVRALHQSENPRPVCGLF